MRRPTSRSFQTIATLTLALLCASGCGYHIRAPYSESIHTIYLPIFKSYSFRQDMNIKLTQMLAEEIRRRTPYVIVNNPEEADATLEGVISFDNKNVLVEAPTNLPRHVMANMKVDVTFTDNRNANSKTRTIPAAVVNEMASFYPEIGESASAGFEKVMEKIVRDIVNMMEEPWGDEYLGRDEMAADDEAQGKPARR